MWALWFFVHKTHYVQALEQKYALLSYKSIFNDITKIASEICHWKYFYSKLKKRKQVECAYL